MYAPHSSHSFDKRAHHITKVPFHPARACHHVPTTTNEDENARDDSSKGEFRFAIAE